MGHEDWVFSGAWQPQAGLPEDGGAPPVPCLLSASVDRTMMLWRPEASTGWHPSNSSRYCTITAPPTEVPLAWNCCNGWTPSPGGHAGLKCFPCCGPMLLYTYRMPKVGSQQQQTGFYALLVT